MPLEEVLASFERRDIQFTVAIMADPTFFVSSLDALRKDLLELFEWRGTLHRQGGNCLYYRAADDWHFETILMNCMMRCHESWLIASPDNEALRRFPGALLKVVVDETRKLPTGVEAASPEHSEAVRLLLQAIERAEHRESAQRLLRGSGGDQNTAPPKAPERTPEATEGRQNGLSETQDRRLNKGTGPRSKEAKQFQRQLQIIEQWRQHHQNESTGEYTTEPAQITEIEKRISGCSRRTIARVVNVMFGLSSKSGSEGWSRYASLCANQQAFRTWLDTMTDPSKTLPLLIQPPKAEGSSCDSCGEESTDLVECAEERYCPDCFAVASGQKEMGRNS